MTKELPGLRMSPPGVKEESYWRPRWLGDHSSSNINFETVPISALSSMQYSRALEPLIREFVIADSALRLVQVLKANGSDGFYRVGLRLTDAPKMGIVFPSKGEDKYLVAILLTLPMGWKNSPPILFMVTETVANLSNSALCCNTPALLHRLDYMVKSIFRAEPPTLQQALRGLTRYLYLIWANANPSAYIDVFVDDFLGLAQEYSHQPRQLRKTLFYTLDKVLRTCDSGDSANHKGFFLLNNIINT